MSKQASISSYQDLVVWQQGVDLAERLYAVTRAFPDEERFGLSMQLRRAGVSISSNIAEGWGRGSTKDYVRFLRIAQGSLAEVETQLIIGHRLGYISAPLRNELLVETAREGKMIRALIRSLSRKIRRH